MIYLSRSDTVRVLDVYVPPVLTTTVFKSAKTKMFCPPQPPALNISDSGYSFVHHE
jgi:hypothetical protein